MKKINILLIALILITNIAFTTYAVTGAIDIGKSEINPSIESSNYIDKAKVSDLITTNKSLTSLLNSIILFSN